MRFFGICQNDPVAYVDSHHVASFVRHVPLKPSHVTALYFDDFHESQIDNKSSRCLYSSIAGLNISGSIARISPKMGPAVRFWLDGRVMASESQAPAARWRRVGDALAAPAPRFLAGPEADAVRPQGMPPGLGGWSNLFIFLKKIKKDRMIGRHHFFTEGIWCHGVLWLGTSGSSSRSGAVDEWRFERGGGVESAILLAEPMICHCIHLHWATEFL